MEAIQIIVNGLVLDVPENAQASITYEGNNIGNLSDRNGDFGKTFNLPMTGNNRTAFGLSDLVESDADPNTLLPCQVFVNNWQVFNGTIKVARYFGNQIQVELIGGLGKLLDQAKELTLADFDYNFPIVECKSGVYEDLLIADDNGLSVGKVDAGLWSQSENIKTGTLTPKWYCIQLPLWYDLLKVLTSVTEQLGFTLAGDILTDNKIDGVYLQQGYWGANRENEQYTGSFIVAEDSDPFYRLQNSLGFTEKVLNITSSQVPWANVSGSQQFDTNIVANGKYKCTIKWDFASFGTGGAFSNDYKFALLFGNYSGTGSDYYYYAIGETELTFNQTMTGAGSITIDIDFANTISAQVILIAKYQQGTTAGQVIDLYNLSIDIEYNFLDEPCFFQRMRAQDVLPRISVNDLFLDICQRFGYYVSADQTTNEIRFDKLSKLLLRERAIDWNSKIYTDEKAMFLGQYETTFSFGDYAAKNWYEDAGSLNTGYLLANVTNKDSEATAYTSIGHEVTTGKVANLSNQTMTISFGGEGNQDLVAPNVGDTRSANQIMFVNGVGHQSTGTGTYTLTVPPPTYRASTMATVGGFNLITVAETFGFENNTVVYGKLGTATGNMAIQVDNQLNDVTITIVQYLEPFFGGWQSILNERYGWLQSILSNPRVHKVLVRIRPTDIPFDYTRPIYWNCAYWYLISVQDWNPINGDTAVALLAYLPDYPNG